MFMSFNVSTNVWSMEINMSLSSQYRIWKVQQRLSGMIMTTTQQANYTIYSKGNRSNTKQGRGIVNINPA